MKGATVRQSLCHLKKTLEKSLQVLHLKSVRIFSTLGHPCSWFMNTTLLFVYLTKSIFYGFLKTNVRFTVVKEPNQGIMKYALIILPHHSCLRTHEGPYPMHQYSIKSLQSKTNFPRHHYFLSFTSKAKETAEAFR